MECSIISPALSLLMKRLVIGQRQKLIISRLFIGHHTVVWFAFGQHLVTTRVVHLPKRTESDQAMRAVHSRNSWFEIKFPYAS